MDLINVGYCNTCNKQFKGKVGLAKHRRRMHAVAYNQEATEIHIANHANQTKPRWTDEDSRRMAQIEIDIFFQKADIRRFPINNAIAEQFPERSVTAIKIHRVSTKYQEPVRTLQASDDIQLYTTRHTLHIHDTITNTNTDTNTNYDINTDTATLTNTLTNTNNDTNINALTDTFTDSHNNININITTNIHTCTDTDLNNSFQQTHAYTDQFNNLETHINSQYTETHTNLQDININNTYDINLNTNDAIQDHPSINNNCMNRNVESIQNKNHSLNNTNKNIKLNILQYILTNIPNKSILNELLLHIQNFKYNNNQYLIDLDYSHLLKSSNIPNNKVNKILNSNSINRSHSDNIGFISNRALKRRNRRILYSKNLNYV